MLKVKKSNDVEIDKFKCEFLFFVIFESFTVFLNHIKHIQSNKKKVRKYQRTNKVNEPIFDSSGKIITQSSACLATVLTRRNATMFIWPVRISVKLRNCVTN